MCFGSADLEFGMASISCQKNLSVRQPFAWCWFPLRVTLCCLEFEERNLPETQSQSFKSTKCSVERLARRVVLRFSFCLILFLCFAQSETEFYANFVRKKVLSYHSIEFKKSLSYYFIE